MVELALGLTSHNRVYCRRHSERALESDASLQLYVTEIWAGPRPRRIAEAVRVEALQTVRTTAAILDRSETCTDELDRVFALPGPLSLLVSGTDPSCRLLRRWRLGFVWGKFTGV